MLIRLLLTLILASIGGSSDLILADDTEHSLICSYEDPCPKDTVVRTAVEYGINVIVKSVDLDGENGDFLLIKSGTQINDGTNGVTFTYINHERKYVSLLNEVLIRFHVDGRSINEDNTHNGFELTVQRFDRINEEVLNFPRLNSHYPSITVAMKMLGPFNEALYIFRETVAILGQDYVDNVDGFDLAAPISENDVHVILTASCPVHWPNRTICHRITFALLLSLSEEPESYQLNEYHLLRMWENASYFFNEENTPTVTIYTKHYYLYIPWIVAISVFIVIFAVSYLIIGCFCSRIIKLRRMQRKELEDKEENERRSFENDHKDDAIYNMDPNPLQPVPPALFQNDVDYFDPDRQSLSAPRRMTSQNDNFNENLLNIGNKQFFVPRTSSSA